jgi:hypothetical protein
MIIICHRINTIEELKKIPKEYGVEIDVRGYGDKMVLTHDPIKEQGSYDELEEYLQNYDHKFIIFIMSKELLILLQSIILKIIFY